MDQNIRWLRPENSREYIKLTLVKGSARKYPEDIGQTLVRGDFEQAVDKRTGISIEQVLEAEYEGQDKPKFVLMEGAPGIGKSCLAWELCRMWEKETPCMKEYRLVILLRLREKEVQNISNVRQLFYFYDAEDKESLVKEVVNELGSDILFILDGFDELPKTYQSDGFLLLKLINKHLPGSTVLVTTRSSATEELLKSAQPQKRIEVVGFDQKSVEAYASGVFKDESSEKLMKFKAYISPNNPVVNSMMYVPLNAAIMVYIFENNPDSLLPRTLTELYLQLCFTILNKALQNQGLEKVDY